MRIAKLAQCLAVASTIVLATSPALRAEPVIDLTATKAPANCIWIDSLDVQASVYQEYSTPKIGKSVDLNPLKMNNVVYVHGIGSHSESEMRIALNGSAARFEAVVGLDDEVLANGSVTFEVWVDGKKAADSGVMLPKAQAKRLSVDLTGAQQMVLKILAGAGNDTDHADWGGGLIVLAPGAKTVPQAIRHPLNVPGRLVSVAPSAKPAIHGPRVVGTTPGNPFMFLIPATGEGTLKYSAKNLPEGLTLDSKTGVITGSLKQAGEYSIQLKVKGPKGTATRDLKIVGGTHKLALTPPMGWNSWNAFADDVDDTKVRMAIDWMVKSGLAAHGYQFVNIDDTWEGQRSDSGEILTNKKFPNMKALADYAHSKGLKLGIYSSPGPKTCAQYEGSYQHEEQDAKTYAKWGIDYLKHDWCSYGSIALNQSLPELQKPYKTMRTALDSCGRDIVYSLCQYGMGDVWKWGEEIGGNCWRTGFDIRDAWWSVTALGFSQSDHYSYAGPGHWNDPDMLVVGKLGWSAAVRPTSLRPNEQISHITLWSMLASPMLIGCDLSQMDQLTLDVLTNDEVIDINQDPLGKAAHCIAKNGDIQVWTKPLSDGTIAVGLFNLGLDETKATAKWSDLGISGAQPVRDLWLHKDLGKFSDSYAESVPSHGVVLVKIGKPKSN